MAYNRTEWMDGSTALSAEHMNNIEQGIVDAHDILDDIVDSMWPIGSVMINFTPENPSTRPLLAGTHWVQIKDRFLLAAGDVYGQDARGGSADAIVPAHAHTASFSGTPVVAHSHGHAGTNAAAVSAGEHHHTGPSHTHTGPAHTHTMSHTHSGPSHSHSITANSTGANYFLTVPQSPNNQIERISVVGSLTFHPGTGGGSISQGPATNVLRSANVVNRLTKTDSSSGTTGAASSSSTGPASSAVTGYAGTGATGEAGAHTHALTGNTATGGAFTPAGSVTVNTRGEAVAGKNMPPYQTVYVWRRDS